MSCWRKRLSLRRSSIKIIPFKHHSVSPQHPKQLCAQDVGGGQSLGGEVSMLSAGEIQGWREWLECKHLAVKRSGNEMLLWCVVLRSLPPLPPWSTAGDSAFWNKGSLISSFHPGTAVGAARGQELFQDDRREEVMNQLKNCFIDKPCCLKASDWKETKW